MKMLNKMMMLILNIRCWCNLPISAGSLIDLLVVGISSEWREVEFSEKHLQNLKKILLNKMLIHKKKKIAKSEYVLPAGKQQTYPSNP